MCSICALLISFLITLFLKGIQTDLIGNRNPLAHVKMGWFACKIGFMHSRHTFQYIVYKVAYSSLVVYISIIYMLLYTLCPIHPLTLLLFFFCHTYSNAHYCDRIHVTYNILLYVIVYAYKLHYQFSNLNIHSSSNRVFIRYWYI